METAAQSCARLVTALEDLVAQETVALGNRDYAAASAIQDRAEPVVEWITAHASSMAPGLRERLAAIVDRRAANGVLLEHELGQARDGLQQIGATRRRMAKIAPAYGGDTPTPPARLSAIG